MDGIHLILQQRDGTHQIQILKMDGIHLLRILQRDGIHQQILQMDGVQVLQIKSKVYLQRMRIILSALKHQCAKS